VLGQAQHEREFISSFKASSFVLRLSKVNIEFFQQPVKNRMGVSAARIVGKTNLTQPVLFVIRTVDDSTSLKGGDHGEFSSD
jgi:hypothetical protein